MELITLTGCSQASGEAASISPANTLVVIRRLSLEGLTAIIRGFDGSTRTIGF